MATLPSILGDLLVVAFETPGPPGHAAGWIPAEGWLRPVADLATMASAVAVPAALLAVKRREPGAAFPRVVWVLAAFILAGGVALGAGGAAAWWPADPVLAGVRAAAAVVSAVTGALLVGAWLVGALPRGLSVPPMSRDHLRAFAHIEALEVENTELRAARTQLEQHSSAMAVRERRLRDAVRSAKACAVLWEAATGEVVWEAGYREMLRDAGVDGLPDVLTWDGLVGSAEAAALAVACRGPAERGEVFHRRFALAGHEGVWDVRVTATPEQGVAGRPATMLGLLGLVPFGQSVQGSPSGV